MQTTPEERALLDASPYKAMELWHSRMESRPYYIINRQEDAKRTNVPVNAIFYSYDSERWITIEDLPPKHQFREEYKAFLASYEVDKRK